MIWIRTFLQELDYGFGNLTDKATILADNNDARSLSKNSSIHSQVKHMKIKYYWQHQQIEHSYLQFNYISFTENVTDDLTKSLELNSFKVFRNNLIKMMNLYSSSD